MSDTYRKLGNVTLHRARVVTGPIRVGDAVRLEVDHAARTSTRRNHSATHLLHWALKEVVGEHAQQKGALVGPDILRFDFAHNQPLSSPEMERIEDLVNTKILTNAPVQTDVLGIAEARAKGAVAIFEEKYGDVAVEGDQRAIDVQMDRRRLDGEIESLRSWRDSIRALHEHQKQLIIHATISRHVGAVLEALLEEWRKGNVSFWCKDTKNRS